MLEALEYSELIQNQLSIINDIFYLLNIPSNVHMVASGDMCSDTMRCDWSYARGDDSLNKLRNRRRTHIL